MTYLRLARRQNGRFSIQAKNSMNGYFNLGDRFEVAWVGRQLVLVKDPMGSAVCKTPTSYCAEGYTRQIEFFTDDCDLPGFCVDEAEFESEGEYLTWTRPDVYKLQWPTRGSLSGDVGLDLKKRLESAHRHGETHWKVLARVPQWARNSFNWSTYTKNVGLAFKRAAVDARV